MNKIKIQNGAREIILSFSTEEEREFMRQAIINCVDNEKDYPSIMYEDKSDRIIFSATYLKNSLILFPN